MRKFGFIVLMMGLSVGALWADDAKKPGYQIEDNTFFDPNKKTVKEQPYSFSVDYRIEAGYAQHQQRTIGLNYPDMYLHGARLGATFTFNLPLHFSMQTGLLYTLLYGKNEQHWRSIDAPSTQIESIQHRVLAHNLTVPVRVFYTVPLWKQLNLFFYTGPQLQIGLAQNDYMNKNLSPKVEAWLQSINVPTEPYNRMADELIRTNIQYGVGGGLEWDRYRLQAGYDFGLNNLIKHKAVEKQHMWEWGWYVTFGYKL